MKPLIFLLMLLAIPFAIAEPVEDCTDCPFSIPTAQDGNVVIEVSKPASMSENYIIYNKGYYQLEDGSWQDFNLNMPTEAQAIQFDNLQEDVWFILPESTDSANPIKATGSITGFDVADFKNNIVVWACTCDTNADCSLQSNWLCGDSQATGVTGGKWKQNRIFDGGAASNLLMDASFDALDNVAKLNALRVLADLTNSKYDVASPDTTSNTISHSVVPDKKFDLYDIRAVVSASLPNGIGCQGCNLVNEPAVDDNDIRVFLEALTNQVKCEVAISSLADTTKNIIASNPKGVCLGGLTLANGWPVLGGSNGALANVWELRQELLAEVANDKLICTVPCNSDKAREITSCLNGFSGNTAVYMTNTNRCPTNAQS